MICNFINTIFCSVNKKKKKWQFVALVLVERGTQEVKAKNQITIKTEESSLFLYFYIIYCVQQRNTSH